MAGKKQRVSIFESGRYYYNSFDFKNAINVFENLDQENFAPADFYLGECYFHGNGVNKDEVKAFMYYDKGAKMKDLYCLMRAAMCYDNGFGTFKNVELAAKLYAKGIKLLNKAMKRGDSIAMYIAADFWMNGYGTTADYSSALIYYRKAFERGENYAAYELVRKTHYFLTEHGYQDIVDDIKHKVDYNNVSPVCNAMKGLLSKVSDNEYYKCCFAYVYNKKIFGGYATHFFYEKDVKKIYDEGKRDYNYFSNSIKKDSEYLGKIITKDPTKAAEIKAIADKY